MKNEEYKFIGFYRFLVAALEYLKDPKNPKFTEVEDMLCLMHSNYKRKHDKKVFLGGTCAGYKWRNKLIPMLECKYYNPLVKNWSENNRLQEVHERETCDYVLYTLTSSMKGVYSIAEIMDDCHHRPNRLIVCLLKETFTQPIPKDVIATMNLVKEHNVPVVYTLEEVAKLINERN